MLTLALVVRSGIFEVKSHDEPINSAMRAAMAETRPELSTEDSLAIDKRFPTAHVTNSGLRYVVRAPGEGKPVPRAGDLVTIRYAGQLLDGTPIDSSYQGGLPYTFRIGEGHVIAGVEEAVLTMKKGERRTLIVPYWLAKSAAPASSTLPANATLVFEVELVDFK